MVFVNPNIATISPISHTHYPHNIMRVFFGASSTQYGGYFGDSIKVMLHSLCFTIPFKITRMLSPH